MTMRKYLLLPIVLLYLSGTSTLAQQLYFPAPQANSPWETEDPDAIGWCTDQLPPLLEFLEQSNTKAFIVLKGGKIVIEEYFGTFTADSNWYWASAGKSLTAFLVGRAQQEGFLDINASTSTYLGPGWTNLNPAQEEAITVWHQLTMTSGLDDSGVLDCTDPACLTYLAEPGSRWSYHNAPYTLLDPVLENATGIGLNTFLFTRLTQTTGINGLYLPVGFNNVFFSRARSMARFGLLMQGGGAWAGNPILSDAAYYQAMITPSQSLNEAYGYLWWLNGSSTYLLPGLQFPLPGPAMPNTPLDVYAALGRDGQILNISPSTGLVVVRMGASPGGVVFVPNLYNDQIWQYLNAVICEATSVAEPDMDSALFHPNPARHFVHIAGAATLRTARAIGADGRSHPIAFAGNRLELSHLIAGIYLVEAIGMDGARYTARIVVEQ
jgi:CubicO group peptidase (beta-lactamase class C family)